MYLGEKTYLKLIHCYTNHPITPQSKQTHRKDQKFPPNKPKTSNTQPKTIKIYLHKGSRSGTYRKTVKGKKNRDEETESNSEERKMGKNCG